MRHQIKSRIVVVAALLLLLAGYITTYFATTDLVYYGEKPPQGVRYCHDKLRYYAFYPAYLVESAVRPGEWSWSRGEMDFLDDGDWFDP